jgi:ribulose-phosphate 3-epimerase
MAPSILSADFLHLQDDLEKAGEAKYIHFDVMDGLFVPSISFGLPVLKAVRKATTAVMDVHLMIQDPIRYVKAFKEAGADILTVHVEACKDVEGTLNEIKNEGMKVGLSLCPETDLDAIKPYLALIDMLLIMSVHPGFGGQAYIPESTAKIKEAREMIAETHKETYLEVDGGIYQSNVREILEAGANVIVAGTAVFKGDIAGNIRAFHEIMASMKH